MRNSVDGTLDGVTKFTGKDLDEDTGLYYFNARWYDQEIGRFISEDLARDGLNWYFYCKNNPVYYSDPDGQAAESFLDKFIEFQYNLNYIPSRLSLGYIKGASNAVVTTAIGLYNTVKVVTPSGFAETMSESRALGTKIGKQISTAIQNPEEAYESVKASVINSVSKVGDYIQTSDQEAKNGDWGNLAEDYGYLAGYTQTQVLIGALTDGVVNTGKTSIVAEETTSTIGYHATLPEYAESIKVNGFRESVSGRAGGSGVYVNNTIEGAIAEYRKYNKDGPEPVISKVEYNVGMNVMIENPGTHIKGPLPINGDTLTFESTQKEGTYNTIIRNRSIKKSETVK